VIGATGQQGGEVARALLTGGRAVHAFVRDPGTPAARALRDAGADLAVGDLDDLGSLHAAMTGVDGVFLVLTMMTGPHVTLDGVQAEIARGRTVADAAAEAGVAHLVYSSIAGADQPTGVPHVESKGQIEAHLRSLGLPRTILRPVFFMENFTTLMRPAVVGGELQVSLGLRPEAPLQLLALRDLGTFAALAFGDPDRFLGRELVIAGDRLSGSAIAEQLGQSIGRPARFSQIPAERLRAFDEQVAAMFAWLDGGGQERADLTVLRESHPELMTFAGWLARAAPTFTDG
jgi:uncharacterized protein YbjT (DUF2867 family)